MVRQSQASISQHSHQSITDGHKAGGMVDSDLGGLWVADLAAGTEVVLTFPAVPLLNITSPGEINTLSGGRMSTFSTWNPSNENTIKPVVSAPGGNILSTYLASQGGYAVLSGTSMATPFTAGVVALYLQAKGKGISPKVINAALSGTASPVVFNDGGSDSAFLTSVAQQGGGLVDAYKMVHGTIAMTEANLAFNDTANHIKKAEFFVQNNGKTTETFTLTHVPAANAYAFDAADTTLVATFPPPLDTKYASIKLSDTTVTIKPGEKKSVKVSATPDPSLDASLVPFYSGFINITGGGDSISIPYGGAATTMKNIEIIAGDGPWPFFDDELFFSQSGNVSTFKPSAQSFPIFLWNTRWATLVMRVDVVSVNGKNPVRTAGLATVGSVPTFPSLDNPRGSAGTEFGAEWDGTLADGGSVKSGSYKFVLRFLKVFGDSTKASDYETYESDVFVMDMS
jgi:hypothetical protein